MSDAGTPEHPPIEPVLTLLRAARDEPERRVEIGTEAAALWWKLDEAGLTGGEPPEPWEAALLALAAWHTGDDRLRLQRADDGEIDELLSRLGG